MDMRPLISIIVPVYNVELYLEECVRSILRQSYEEFELILVDDGSPDRCGEICEELAKRDKRIKVIHQQNQGLSGARNTGIRAAKGEYITFVDSDDRIAPNMLIDLLHLSLKLDADISLCGIYKTADRAFEAPQEKLTAKLWRADEFMDIILKIHSNRTLHYACGKLYKRKVLDDEHFPAGMLNEDVEGTFKAVMRSERIAETLSKEYYYMNNDDSITNSRFGENYLCLTKVWKRVLDIAKEQAPQYTEKVSFNLKRMDFTILTQSLIHGDRSTDRRYKDKLAEIHKRLKANIPYLLRGPMVTKRKLAVLAVGYFYTPIRLCLRAIKRR